MRFTAELEGFDEILRVLDNKTLNKVINRTANEEGRRFSTEVAKNVRKEYNIKSSEIKSKISIFKASGDNHRFELTISSPRLDLARFVTSTRTKKVWINRGGKRYKAKRKVVRVKVKRGKQKILKQGFMVNSFLFKRKGESRMPIKKLSTISITDMFRKDIIDKGFEKVKENYPRTLERNLLFYLR